MVFERRYTPEETFDHELIGLQKIYASHLVAEAMKNADLLIDLHERWQDSLALVASGYGVIFAEGENLPAVLEAESLKDITSREGMDYKKTILGFSGPGATGKETLAKALQFPKVINTTTRNPRDYEEQGVHYHFVTEEEFGGLEADEAFATITERPGRGRYGITTEVLLEGLSQSDTTIIEENPETLSKLSEYIAQEMPETQFILTYILPPNPVQLHLAVRLANRCLVAGEDYRTAIQSTLGQRQIDEFLSVSQAKEYGTPVLYVINDSVDRAVDVIRGVTK